MAKKGKDENRKDGGIDAKTKQRLVKAVRQIWHWTSYAKRIVEKRCLVGGQGFSKCELCQKKVPRIYVDHISPCGQFDAGYLERLFVDSTKLQGLCKKCHDGKTRIDRKEIALFGD